MHVICKQFTFCAAHQLPNHEGKCKNLHGHSYRLEVTLKGTLFDKGPAKGMLMDFGDLKRIVENEVLEQIDHRFLNEIWDNPTAEEMAQAIFEVLKEHISDLWSVKLWESETSWAMYSDKI